MFKENRKLAATDTLIGQGTSFEGLLKSEAVIRIEGDYQGEIECQSDVIVGECGIAKSGISARDVIVAGRVYGDVVTQGRLTITSSGQLHGNITANTLLIQEGGIFTGSCRMERAPEPKSRGADNGEPNANPPQKPAKDKSGGDKARQAG